MARVAAAVVILVGGLSGEGDAQVLVDRIVARVEGQVIRLSDIRLARRLGLVPDGPAEDITASAEALVDRALMLIEANRFAVPAFGAGVLAAEVGALTAKLGAEPALRALLADMGVDQAEIAERAAENLKLRAYIAQRFGATATSEGMTAWLRDLRRRATVDLVVPDAR